MAWCLFGTKSLPATMLNSGQFEPLRTNVSEIRIKIHNTQLFYQGHTSDDIVCDISTIFFCPDMLTQPTPPPPPPLDAAYMRRSIGSDIRHQACWVIVGWTLWNKLRWNQNTKIFIHKNCIWKYRLRNGGHFVQGEMSLRAYFSLFG